MQDISLHILDILENSAKAGASRVQVAVSRSGSRLRIRLEDNGPGMPDEVAANPTDPYRTTRTERPVGLGLALMKQSAEESGGRFGVTSVRGRGVCVDAEFELGSVDARPVGDLPGVLATAVAAWPDLDVVVTDEDHGETVLDMALVKAELDGMPPSHPAVRGFIESALREGLDDVMQWADGAFRMGQ